MSKRIKIGFYAVLAITVFVLYAVISDSTARYSVPAKVYGTDIKGNTIFKTEDGNLWAYEMPAHLTRGTEVTLEMYDRIVEETKDEVILNVSLKGKE